MEWISTREELPPFDERVLLSDEHGWISTGNRIGGDRYEYTSGEEMGCRPTYWMPLPNPPIPYRTVKRSG